MTSTWQPIVVGVDGSPESVRAATLGAALARKAGVACHLVHAAPDYWAAASSAPELGVEPAELDRASVDHARTLLINTLAGHVPESLVRGLVIRVGRAPLVIAEEAARVGATLAVLGGKHHHAFGRLGGSTVTHLVRMGCLPVLATNGTAPVVARVLAAVDLSYAARPTIETAAHVAELFGAELRVLHVVEPMPVIPGVRLPVADDEVYRSTERLFELNVAPLVALPRSETILRRGRAAATIVSEAEQWRADLVVVGSHGKGWVDRLLLGSVSERLLQLLPAPVLVVPVTRPDGARRQTWGTDILSWEAEVRV